MSNLVMILILVILMVVVIDFLIKIKRAIRVERRLARYSVHSIMDDNNNLEDAFCRKYNHFLVRFRERFQGNKFIDNSANKYSKYIIEGNKVYVIDFIAMKLIIGILFVLLVVLSIVSMGKDISFLFLVVSFIIGYYIYDFYLYFSYQYKIKGIRNDILRAVIIMNHAFKAGKSTMQAVLIASEELPNPIALEFKRIYDDLSLGISSDVAFLRFSRRVNLEEVRYLSSSLIILNKTGGNIVSVFSSIERTLFERKKLEEELKNSTAASNLVVKVLMVVPVLFCGVIYLLNPNYFSPLFESVFGYMVLFIIFIMFVCFVYMLNKIMKVKV